MTNGKLQNSYTVPKSYKSSAVAEMGDRGHNRHGPKRGGGTDVHLSRGWDPV